MRAMQKVCSKCGAEFSAYKTRMRFCSRECAVRRRPGRSRRSADGNNAQCAGCGRPFYRKPSQLAKYIVHTCSRLCRGLTMRTRYSGTKNPNFRAIPPKKCVGCGSSFSSYVKSRRYCSAWCSQRISRNEVLANVRRGAEAELQCAAELRRRGYVAFRSVASRGPYDVIGIGANDIVLIQCKRTKARARRAIKSARVALARAVAPKWPGLRKELWTWVDGDGWTVSR